MNNNESYKDFQYNSCIARGICSISPRTSALQAILILYLKITAELITKNTICDEIQKFFLNTITIAISNPNFNDNSYINAINNFKKFIPLLFDEYYQNKSENIYISKKQEINNIFNKTEKLLDAIKYGEAIINQNIKNLPDKIRDLYNILLIIAKSISINIIELESYGINHPKSFKFILNIFRTLNLKNNDLKTIKEKIFYASKIDCNLLKRIKNIQKINYGEQTEKEVSFSTVPNKAILVVGTNIKELEIILESTKNEGIDIYTHDEMILAHTYPKFWEYDNLKGQYGQGIENCLIDFATFPGPIILTKNSLHNIENFYRGRLFTTDSTTLPKGVIKIDDYDLSEVIKSAKESKGFKKGKKCKSSIIGFNYQKAIKRIKTKLEKNKYKQFLIIGANDSTQEENSYFENLIKLTPENVLIISFSYKTEKNNFIHINNCYDSFSCTKIVEFLYKFKNPITIFIPKCVRNSFSQIVYYSTFKDIDFYLGECTPIILNPSLMKTFRDVFSVHKITNIKKDLKEIIQDK